MCQAGLYFLYILSMNVVALHSSSGLPGQDSNSGWSLGKTVTMRACLGPPESVFYFESKTVLYVASSPPVHS